jgi:MFS family permease
VSEAPPARRTWPLLAVLCLAQVMLVLDVVVVVVALPSMRADLGIDAADLQWMVTAYGLAYGGFMITAGRVGDLFGHRRVLLCGLAVFTLASPLRSCGPPRSRGSHCSPCSYGSSARPPIRSSGSPCSGTRMSGWAI